MSTKSKSIFSEEGFNSPMLIEFQTWIKNSLKWRMTAMGYLKEGDNLSPALNDAVNKVLLNHTNLDYLTCSDDLTSALEETLVYHGIGGLDAIRLSWKWSD